MNERENPDRLPLKRRVGLFDSDCLEAAGEGSFLLRAIPGFGIRPRVQPLAAKIEQLHALARDLDLAMILTHCCSANPVSAATHPHVLVVPLDADDQSWLNHVGEYRLFNIEKHHHAPLNHSFLCRHFDAFQHNANARRLLQRLNIPRWCLFGHGFDLCVDSAAKGLLIAGCQVHLLTDVLAPSATGYGPYGTPESGRAILSCLQRVGVTAGVSDDFLRECRAEASCA